MSSPSGSFGFGNLGMAQGSIQIAFNQAQIVAQTRQAGQQVAQNLGVIDTAAKKAELSLKSMLGGVGAGFAAQRFAQFAIHADEVATAYARQSVAAVSLAGSQQKLNALLESYDKVTGRAIDKANLLSQVTQLQAIGFADTTAEIERFATAVRGISIATGRPQDYVQQQLQLAISNQSTMRLDQIGLGVDEVKNKVNELKAANRGLSDAQAYQNAILTIAEKKYGALTKSAAAQATGLEKARKAWADLTLQIGDSFGPATSGVMTGLQNELQGISDKLKGVERDAIAAGNALRGMKSGGMGEFGGAVGDIVNADPISDQLIPWIERQLGLNQPTPGGPQSSRAGSGGRGRGRGALPPVGDTADQRAAKLDYEQTITDIERDAQSARIEATQSYESQRTQTIANYERTIVRDAEDFGRQRARAEAQFAKQIADFAEDTAKREADAAENLAERIADAQAATAKRISDIEDNYRRNRERAERTHKDNLLDAAARLDATAVFNEQKRFARESEEAKTAHDDQISQEQENLAERLQQEQESHAERLQDAREADTERLADMQEAFEEQKRLEDEDRALRLERMAEDHATQLADAATAHAEQMAQIAQHEAEELKSAQEAHLKQLEAAGIFNKNWKAIQDAREREALASWDRWWQGINRSLATQGAMTPAEAGALDPWRGGNLLNPQPLPSSNGGNTRNFNVAPGAITVVAATGQSPTMIANEVHRQMIEIFRELAN